MKNLYLILFLIAFQATKAQVLWSDDFDGYTVGALNTNLTGQTPGQGGWYVETLNLDSNAIVTPETGKGNVLVLKRIDQNAGYSQIILQQVSGILDNLWKNRTMGNNILKYEYEIYGSGSFNEGPRGGILNQGTVLIDLKYSSLKNLLKGIYFKSIGSSEVNFKKYNTTTFPSNTWIKVEMFIDYNTKNVFFYLPTLNLQGYGTFSHNLEPESISFSIYALDTLSVVKLDNMKISAIPTLPSYLNVDEFLTSKFNIFPNPTTDIVTITNTENIGIEQIEVYDINGKNIKSHNYRNQNEIQLNISDLAADTYVFHIKTNQGTAVKKVIKK